MRLKIFINLEFFMLTDDEKFLPLIRLDVGGKGSKMLQIPSPHYDV